MRKRLVLSGVILTVLVALFLYRNKSKKGPALPIQTSGAFESLSFWSQERSYPHPAMPAKGHAAAFERISLNPHKRSGKIEETAPWYPIGPHNLAGRTLSLAFNPQNPKTLFAGSASGGLWRSFTGGRGAAAWHRIQTGYPVLGVSSIAFAPGDSNVIYIGTGEVYSDYGVGENQAARWMRGTYGLGILKSADGGTTWTKSLDWAYHQERGVWAVEVNPRNPNTVWSATTEGVYRSYNAGASWDKVHDVIMAMDLVIHPVDTNIVVATHGNFGSEGHGIYRTTDAGTTWKKIESGIPAFFEGKAVLDISESNPDIVFASIGNGFSVNSGNATWLCKSTDAGETWTIISQEDYSLWQGWYAHDVAIYPPNPEVLFLGGIGMHKSVTGGREIFPISTFDPYVGQVPPGEPEGPPNYMHGDNHAIEFHPTNPNIVYFANDAGVWRTTNGGVSFESCNGGYQTAQFYHGFASSQRDSNLAIGGLQDNATVIFKGTPAWSRYHLKITRGDGGWAAIDPRDDQVLYASNWFLNLYKSIDGGDTWEAIFPPFEASTASVFEAPAVLGFNNPDVLYGGREYIYKSTDGGATWTTTNAGQPLDGNPMLSMAISHQTTDVVYAATAPIELESLPAAVFRTRDGGASWQNITGDLPNRFPRAITVNPYNDQELYIAFSGFGTSHLFRSDNGGNDWVDVGIGLPDVPTSAIAIDPLNPAHIYVGNDIGVYVSPDRGQNWEPFGEGLPEAILVVDLSMTASNRKLRAVTHGSGVFERDLPDASPVAIEDPELDISTFTLKQNYPNPFNASTAIHYVLAENALVHLEIFNQRGQKVRSLIESQLKRAGQHQVIWYGDDDAGSPVASGVYSYRLRAGQESVSKQMVLLK